LDFDEEVVNEAMINIDQVKERFVEVHEEVLSLFEGINREDPSADGALR
jgi:hypothetical protein